MPVLRPMDSSMKTRSSVTMLPLAPGANGHPPMPPNELSSVVMPSSSAAMALASPRPRVLCRCTPVSFSSPISDFTLRTSRLICAGFA